MKVEVLTGPERRRRWQWDKKVRLVEETLVPGTTVAEVARHGISASLLFYWRRQARDGLLGRSDAPPVLLPLEMAVEPPTAPVPPEETARPRGMIEIELGNGRRLRVDADVDAEALGRVLGVLERR